MTKPGGNKCGSPLAPWIRGAPRLNRLDFKLLLPRRVKLYTFLYTRRIGYDRGRQEASGEDNLATGLGFACSYAVAVFVIRCGGMACPGVVRSAAENEDGGGRWIRTTEGLASRFPDYGRGAAYVGSAVVAGPGRARDVGGTVCPSR